MNRSLSLQRSSILKMTTAGIHPRRRFTPHQCDICRPFLVTRFELDIYTEQVFSRAEKGCTFLKWCLDWKVFPDEKGESDVSTDGDASMFRSFSTLRIRFMGPGARQYSTLCWLKPRPGAISLEDASEWPPYQNGRRKLLLYADEGPFHPMPHTIGLGYFPAR